MISTLLASNPALVRVLVVVGVLVCAAVGLMLYRAGRTRALSVLAIVGLVGVLALTLSPSDGPRYAFCTVQFSIPFAGIDTLANLVMTLPLALFSALRFGSRLRAFAVFAAVSGLAALIELTQALIPAIGRSCDTDDWFMNTIGAAVGVAFAMAIMTAGRSRVGGPSRQADTRPSRS
ncbi:VanZ like protein [Labedella gwakjiensis]|uniref:VanZ family protein n=1 Tax=Labedella gwakjiensis TaxID=390269 RepID=A0A2P8GV67_9MICO|nr:VanZ family protein [Labedella gwakjiensis]PSL37845.1 VanZ like protein [Labedella gwakjiensis]RUQ87583.1 VanZ family protein [Labedella gwakjiensis]